MLNIYCKVNLFILLLSNVLLYRISLCNLYSVGNVQHNAKFKNAHNGERLNTNNKTTSCMLGYILLLLHHCWLFSFAYIQHMKNSDICAVHIDQNALTMHCFHSFILVNSILINANKMRQRGFNNIWCNYSK